MLRFFTNAINVLPRFFNIWDLLLTLLIAALALGNSYKIALTPHLKGIPSKLLAFNLVCIAGTALNSEHIYFLSFISQLLMWNEPVILFLSILKLPLRDADYSSLSKLLVRLLLLEVIIGFIQVPTYLSTGESESIIGTFHGNAEQYQLFIVLAVLWLIASLQLGRGKRTVLLFSVCTIVALILLIDNKASWAALAISIVAVLRVIPGAQGNIKELMRRALVFTVLSLVAITVVKSFSGTASSKFGNIIKIVQNGDILNVGKIKAVRDVFEAYTTYPQMVVVGSGLGTFYGRASFQYFPFSIRESMDSQHSFTYSSSELTGADDSASMAGVISTAQGVTAFYKQFYRYDKIVPIGSGTADFPTSSYISLLGETGLLGTALYLSICWSVLKRCKESLTLHPLRSESLAFSVMAYGALAYLMCMAAYNFWLDCGRVNTIVWALLAVSLRLSLRGVSHSSTVVDNVDSILEPSHSR